MVRYLVNITRDQVVELSKSTLTRVKCDTLVPPPGGRLGATVACGQEFGSWNAYLKHLIKKHTSKQKGQGGTNHVCKNNKCSAKLHADFDALKVHVETSHMKSVALPCPFANCRPFGRASEGYSFMKEKDLISHFRDAHMEFLGKTLDVHSDLFLPSFEPRPPTQLLPPPDLPTELVSMAAIRLEGLAPPGIPRLWFNRILQNGAEDAMSRSSATPAPSSTPAPRHMSLLAPRTPAPTAMPTPSPRAPVPHRMLVRTPTAHTLLPEKPEPVKDYDMAELPIAFYDEDSFGMQPVDILSGSNFFTHRPIGDVQLVRPLWMRPVPEPETPAPQMSIFHEALKKTVLTQVAQGQG